LEGALWNDQPLDSPQTHLDLLTDPEGTKITRRLMKSNAELFKNLKQEKNHKKPRAIL